MPNAYTVLELLFLIENAEHIVKTSATANSILTYFISYSFYVAKVTKKQIFHHFINNK